MKLHRMIERTSKCYYCRHPRIEHEPGRGCQHEGCCCQEDGTDTKEMRKGKHEQR